MLGGQAKERRREPGLTELAAAKFVETHGRDALRILEERAETATERGHNVAARTWRDLANAAARLLRTRRPAPALPGPARPFVAPRAAWLR